MDYTTAYNPSCQIGFNSGGVWLVTENDHLDEAEKEDIGFSWRITCLLFPHGG